MKFCKNLQRVVDISDPEWAPYWTNYKMLKKLIKELPSLVPAEESGSRATTSTARGRVRAPSHEGASREASPDSHESSLSGSTSGVSSVQQKQGDQTKEAKRKDSETTTEPPETAANSKQELGKSPGEIAFFKLLHAELKKASHFFEKAQQEFTIREERVWEGMEIMKQPNSIMVSEKWSLLARSIYRLYKELLLLETFAIMTYCAFSKILKKHDKVTGYQTRAAFMANMVNKANFANYPKVLQMIARCEQMYEEVSHRLLQEGKHGLYEDERLFINMVSRLNEQALDAANQEGAPNRMEAPRRNVAAANAASSLPVPAVAPRPSNVAFSALQALVEENDARAAAQVSEGHMDHDDDETDDRKRPAEMVTARSPDKRSKR